MSEEKIEGILVGIFGVGKTTTTKTTITIATEKKKKKKTSIPIVFH